MQVKYRNFMFYKLYLLGLFVFSSSDLAFTSITSSQIITESSIIPTKYFPFSQLVTCSRIPNILFFTYMTFFTLTLTFVVIPPVIWITFSSIKFTFTFI